jgi:hypothetical protein
VLVAASVALRRVTMATDIPKLECPIDVMYVIHHALRAEAARVETLVGRLEKGGSLQPVRQAFYR